MLRRKRHPSANSFRLYALGAIFLIPLSIGVLLVTGGARRGEDADKISRQIGSIYAQGLDFSQSANRNIALNVAKGVGIDLQAGKGVLILSKIRIVLSSDCAGFQPGKCGNKGFPVVVERYVLGNRSLRASAFGTPAGLDRSSGKVRDWADDPSARATGFAAGLKPGEVTYAAECYLTAPDSIGGVYSRAMF